MTTTDLNRWTVSTGDRPASLAAPSPVDMLRDAHAHLTTAVRQSTDADDRIIIEHMQCAASLIENVLRAQP